MKEDLSSILIKQSKKKLVPTVLHKFWFIFVLAVLIITCVFTGILADNKKIRLKPTLSRDYMILDDIRVEREDSFQLAVRSLEEKMMANNLSIQPRAIPIDKWDIYLHYRNLQGVSLFETEEKINMLKKIEENLRFYNGNYSNFCLAGKEGTDCSSDSVLSILGYFQNTSTPEEINKTLNLLSKNTSLQSFSGFFVDKDFKENMTKCVELRSRFRFGAPIVMPNFSFSGVNDRFELQNQLFMKFFQNISEHIMNLNESKAGQFKVSIYTENMYSEHFLDYTHDDYKAFAGLLVCIFLGSFLHSRSLFIPFMTVFQLGETLAFSTYIYSNGFEGTQYQELQLWAIVVSIAVCYFQLAVITNYWKRAQTFIYLKGDSEKILAWTFHHVSWKNLCITIMALVAFLVTRFVPLISVMTFGVLGTIFMVTNYILSIVNFLPLLHLADKLDFAFLNKFFPSKAQNTFDSADKEEGTPQLEKNELPNDPSTSKMHPLELSSNKIEDSKGLQVFDNETEKKRKLGKNNFIYIENRRLTWLEKYFFTKHSQFLSICGFAIVIALLILLGFTIFASFKADLVKEPEELLSKNSDEANLKASILSMNTFPPRADEDLLSVDIVWGINGREGLLSKNMWDTRDAGYVVLDTDFYADTYSSQNYMNDFCERVKRNFLVRNQKIVCFMSDFKDYLVNNFIGFPVAQTDFWPRVVDFINTTDIGHRHYVQNMVGVDWVTKKLKFFKVTVLNRVKKSTSRDSLIATYNYWENLTSTERKIAPEDINTFYATAGEQWLWFPLSDPLVYAAGKGIGVTLLVLFFLNILVSGNFFMAIFTTLSVIAQSSAFLSIIYLMGWEFGVSETVAALLVVGISSQDALMFSFEYCFNFGVNRFDRVRLTLRDLGPTLLGTTLISFIGYICFAGSKTMQFYKLSVLFSIFTGFTIFWTLFFLPSICIIIGPQLDEWNIYKACFKKSNMQKIPQSSADEDLADQEQAVKEN